MAATRSIELVSRHCNEFGHWTLRLRVVESETDEAGAVHEMPGPSKDFGIDSEALMNKFNNKFADFADSKRTEMYTMFDAWKLSSTAPDMAEGQRI